MTTDETEKEEITEKKTKWISSVPSSSSVLSVETTTT
jgi:hypothetical protein